ncbi:checkpoint protein Hus1/Mec3 [Pavlovales sp. CCMP2436]|nr:checkpoint protein Hus1/Mec3 [Pavlovales sp. CCMP2436]|mmetsp:Transcript_14407/g.36521  ORF Transcript_14407/g.36521 Transcript_14407/m.36521 type:complete len:296 (+) Transcript_14407:71-958(+)
MKFRARFGNAAQLSKLVQTLDRIGDSCVVHLTTDNVAFAIVGDAGDGIQVWADMSRSSLFVEYRIESKNNNQISFTSKVGNLHRALKSACANTNVQTIVKLTKKTGIPTFSFEIQQPQTQLKITHDVPIRLIFEAEELNRYYEPSIPEEVLANSASVVLPATELKGLRNVVERMRSFSSHIELCATNSPRENTLRLQVHKENLMSITTKYSRLEAVAQTTDGACQTAEAKLEIKKLSKVLQSLIASDLRLSSLICCIIPDKSVVLKCFLADHGSTDQESPNSIVFYLPVQYLAAD